MPVSICMWRQSNQSSISNVKLTFERQKHNITVVLCVCTCYSCHPPGFPLPGELESVHNTLPQLVPQPCGHHSPLPPLAELQTLLGPRPEVCQHRDHRRDAEGDRQAGPAARVPHLCLPAATAARPQSARRVGEDTVRTVDVTATEHGFQHSQGETGLCSSSRLGALRKIQRQVSSLISSTVDSTCTC